MKIVPLSHHYACVILDISVAELICNILRTWMAHQQCNSLLKLCYRYPSYLGFLQCCRIVQLL